MSNQEVKCHPHKPDIVKGALITAYHKGYHRVARVIEEDYGADKPCLIVEYYQLITSKGTKSRNRILRNCHVDYCELVDPVVVLGQKQKELHELYMNLCNAVKDSGS